MLTAGIATVGGGQGKPLSLPAASGEECEGQGVFAERFFAKSVDELMATSAGTKTQLSLEQIVGGADKKDVSGAKDLSEAGTEVSETGEVSANSSLSSAVVTNVAAVFGGEGLQGTQITGEKGQPVKEVSGAGLQAVDVEKVVAGKTPAESVDELKGIAAAVVEPQQRSLVLSASLAGTGASQVAANVAGVSKGTMSGEKLQVAGERAEIKRETKKKGNELSSGGDANTGVVSADASALPVATSIATSSPTLVLHVGVDLPVVTKVETGAASAKSSRVGPVGYKTGANVAAGIVARDGKGDVDRGWEMVAGVGTAGAGAHSTIQHSPNAEVEASAKNALQTPGTGEAAAVKAQGVGAVGAIVTVVQVVAVDGSMGLQGVVPKHSSGPGNEGALPAETVGAAVFRSLETAGGNASPVYDGHGMVSATPTSLEVGIANGSHGWLKIRAELTDGGAVNASVSAASSAGQEMLHRELPSLTAYLQSERLGVNTVVVHATAATTEAHDFSGAMSNGDQRGATQQGGSSQSGDSRPGLAATDSDRSDEPVSFIGLEEADAGALSSAMYGEGGWGGGGWLSVRA